MGFRASQKDWPLSLRGHRFNSSPVAQHYATINVNHCGGADASGLNFPRILYHSLYRGEKLLGRIKSRSLTIFGSAHLPWLHNKNLG